MTERNEQIIMMKIQAGIPKKFWNARLKDCYYTSIKIPDICKSYFLTGIVGSGKTWVASAIANALIEEVPAPENEWDTPRTPVLFRNVPDFFYNLRKGYNRRGETEAEIIGSMMKAPYLILDDCGAEKSSDWTLDRLYLVINSRYENDLPMVITSNLSLDEIGEKIHDRIASRLLEMCNVKKFPNKDWRKGIKKGG